MRKSDRLFQLVNILRAHQPITAKDMAEKLNVSERSIYRYIDDLSVSGVPVYGEAGIGYQLMDGYELPPLQLNQKELEALVLAVNMVSSITGNEFSEVAGSLLSKIEAALPDIDKISDNNEQALRVPGKQIREQDYLLWDEINSAIRGNNWLLVQYKSLQGIESKRHIYPLGLFYWGAKWTVGSWCSLRKEYRDFRLDLIEKIDIYETGDKFPLGVCLDDYIQYQSKKSY
ncbi:MAG: YafY family protein [Cellvibrionales bacterium]|nr:YafY family protein [Cellvibrionales bacterium]